MVWFSPLFTLLNFVHFSGFCHVGFCPVGFCSGFSQSTSNLLSLTGIYTKPLRIIPSRTKPLALMTNMDKIPLYYFGVIFLTKKMM